FQIWTASRAGLPLAESPPVRAMPKPILMGSAAWATNAPAPAKRTTVVSTAIRTARRIDRELLCLIATLSLCAPARRAPLGSGGQTAAAPVALSSAPAGMDSILPLTSHGHRARPMRGASSPSLVGPQRPTQEGEP